MVAAIMLAVAAFGIAESDSIKCGKKPAVEQAEGFPARIALQVVASADALEGLIQPMLAEAAAIWAPYGVEVTPVFSAVRPQAGEATWLTLVARDQPANRIDGKTPAGRRALASLVFVDDTPGTVIYVSLETALQIVRGAGIGYGSVPAEERFAARLLGRSLAHELGHFVLASRSHSRNGLMRQSFGAFDAMASPDRFRLVPESAKERYSACR